MKLALVAVAGLCLTGCIATDPSASLLGRAGTGFAPVPVEDAALPLASAVSQPSPDDLMLDAPPVRHARVAHGVDPIAVLHQKRSRFAELPLPPSPGPVGEARARPSPGLAATPETGGPVRTAGLMDTPLAAPDPVVIGAVRAGGSPIPFRASTSASLVDVETRAEAQQRRQAIRDKYFDAQVRRASSIVCSTCLVEAAQGRRPARQERRDEPVTATP